MRPSNENDHAYIKATWVENYRQSRATQQIVNPVYFPGQRSLIERIFAVCPIETDILVACDPEDERVIYGWAVGRRETATLHYVYVRQEWRGLGIGDRLIQTITGRHDSAFSITHLPGDRRFFSRLAKHAIYNPYLLMR
jgi:GNAT superfamily N-acetyltransferase